MSISKRLYIFLYKNKKSTAIFCSLAVLNGHSRSVLPTTSQTLALLRSLHKDNDGITATANEKTKEWSGRARRSAGVLRQAHPPLCERQRNAPRPRVACDRQPG